MEQRGRGGILVRILRGGGVHSRAACAVNSKTTMDIHAKVKCNKHKQLSGVVNAAFKQNSE